MFQSMHTNGLYNALLKFAIDIFILYDLDLHVIHICSLNNGIANTLSRHCLLDLTRDQPQLVVTLFQPPQVSVEAVSL